VPNRSITADSTPVVENAGEIVMREPVDSAICAARESQQTIYQWVVETFGPGGSNLRCAARANEEMAELLACLSADEFHPKAAEECADIVIVLYRLAERLGVDLHAEVDRKMATNRARTWRLDGHGQGYHVPAA
jgi:NTP pyrophosphatase (non-canonical NTP hydrolase)